MLRFFMPSCNANKKQKQQQKQQRLSCVKVDFKYTMRFYPVALLRFAVSLTHFRSLSVCFYYYIHFDTSSDVGPVYNSFFFAAAAAAACLLCVLMSMLCLKGLAAPPTSMSNANRAPPPTIVRLCAR